MYVVYNINIQSAAKEMQQCVPYVLLKDYIAVNNTDIEILPRKSNKALLQLLS
jgi:hypothetical protein